MLTDQTLEELAPNAHSMIRDTYQKWLNDQTTVYCIMLTVMIDKLSHRFKNAQLQNILQILNESFGTSDDVERYKTTCDIFKARLREGASITDHILYMIEMIECLSKLDFLLHEQLGKDVILNSLPKSYLPFLTHY